jgi:hypothetical protein
MAPLSEKFFELFHAEVAVASNTAHRESIYGIVARNRHNTNSIRHDDVFTLAQNSEASLFQRVSRHRDD